MLIQKSMNSRNHECLSSLIKEGWTKCSAQGIKPIEGDLHARLAFRQTRKDEEKNELWFLQRFVTPEWIQWAINKIFKPNMSGNQYSYQKKPPTVSEFWVFFARTLCTLVKASPSGHLLHPTFALVEQHLMSMMTEARYNKLSAAFHFSHAAFQEVMRHNMSAIISNINLGKILALDESIIATHAEKAITENMTIFIKDKPHPFGILLRGLCGKFERSKCVFFVYGRHKHTGDTCAASKTAVSIINYLEDESTADHIIILDGGYPVATFIPPRGLGTRTKYLCSATKSLVSSHFNRLSEACSSLVKVGKHCTLKDEKNGRLATLHNSAGKDIVIVTDAFTLKSPAVLHAQQIRSQKAPFEFALHLALAPVKSTSEFLRYYPTTSPVPAAAKESMPTLIKYLFNVDVLSPMDLDGKVTREELKKLPVPHLITIANSLGRCKSKKREAVTQFILDNHPKAGETQLSAIRAKAKSSRKRRTTPASMSKHELRELENDNRKMKKILLETGTEPKFHEIYRANYGLQDRFNATLYSCFKFQRASGPFQILGWMSIIIFAINARAMFAELKHQKGQDMSSPCHTATFCQEIVRQIANMYLDEPIMGDETFVIKDKKLLAVRTEADTLELEHEK